MWKRQLTEMGFGERAPCSCLAPGWLGWEGGHSVSNAEADAAVRGEAGLVERAVTSVATQCL